MILINIQISVHYYPHIIELELSTVDKSTFLGMLRQELYAPLLWVFLSMQSIFFKGWAPLAQSP